MGCLQHFVGAIFGNNGSLRRSSRGPSLELVKQQSICVCLWGCELDEAAILDVTSGAVAGIGTTALDANRTANVEKRAASGAVIEMSEQRQAQWMSQSQSKSRSTSK
jgi:hypothetical protein